MKILQCIITVRQAKYYNSISTVYRHRAVVNACVWCSSAYHQNMKLRRDSEQSSADIRRANIWGACCRRRQRENEFSVTGIRTPYQIRSRRTRLSTSHTAHHYHLTALTHTVRRERVRARFIVVCS